MYSSNSSLYMVEKWHKSQKEHLGSCCNSLSLSFTLHFLSAIQITWLRVSKSTCASLYFTMSGLLQDLEKQEVELTVVQKEGEKLLNQLHPAVHTIEEILFEVEKKWRWILQLCHCILSHVQENTTYWQFFRDAHATEKVLRELHKLIEMMMVHPPGPHETLRKQIQGIQERLEEMEVVVQSLSHKSTEIVQLKPRCPDNLIDSFLPLKAVCDYTLNGRRKSA
uniref:desmoplakin-A-like n=1 Tax=Myxine glutinosa TaxID=7769 RepID=UPI00358FE3F6